MRSAVGQSNGWVDLIQYSSQSDNDREKIVKANVEEK